MRRICVAPKEEESSEFNFSSDLTNYLYESIHPSKNLSSSPLLKQLLYSTPAIYLEDQGTELPFPTSFPSLIGITLISLRSRAELLLALFLLLKFRFHFGGEDCQLHSVLSSLSQGRVPFTGPKLLLVELQRG